ANISLNLLLSYHPNEKKVELPFGFDGTFYPPIESVPRRYAIVRANQYMVKLSDSIICYANHFGNTRNLLDFAKRQADKRNISIINLAEQF
ncbi:MAG: hypothetical protein IJP17_05760, partial [Clostridia bacterium]|nr:hypothetical protein [Clostridia bacterium]